MKKIIFLLLFLFIYNFLYSQIIKKDTINKSIIWTWKGKIYDKKSVLDSIKVDYIFYCDSIKRREKIMKNFGL